MNPIEIILIIIGIITIALSCKLVDRKQDQGISKGSNPGEYPISEKELGKVKEKVDKLIAEVSEDAIIRADDSISKLSNETIMAVNEFSDQILERIRHNHEEVVFLYNMLNEKEKELKVAVNEVDLSKKAILEIIESKNGAIKEQENNIPASQASALSSAYKDINTKTSMPEQQFVEAASEIIAFNSFSSINNSEILSLYNQGKSVMEISKQLGLGQGEVKLVIDLFKGKK